MSREGRHCNRCIVDVGQGYVPSCSPGVVPVLPGDPSRYTGQASLGNSPARGKGGPCAVQGHQRDGVSGSFSFSAVVKGNYLSVQVISCGVVSPLYACAVTFAKFRMRCSVCLYLPPMQLGSVMTRWWWEGTPCPPK